MEKIDFIKKLLVKFMSNADEIQAKQSKEDLERILPENIDFDYLYDMVLTKYDKRTMPIYKDLEPHFRRKNFGKENTVFWTITVKKKGCDCLYDFPVDMKYSLREAILAYKKDGLEYVSDNRGEIYGT